MKRLYYKARSMFSHAKKVRAGKHRIDQQSREIPRKRLRPKNSLLGPAARGSIKEARVIAQGGFRRCMKEFKGGAGEEKKKEDSETFKKTNAV